MNVRVDGADLFYTLRGQGPVCIVPSAIGTRPYERQTDRLCERFTIACVDLRGGGSSTGEPAGLSYDVLADDLEAVRRDIGAERVSVLGHSILGILAIEYARRRPASVSHVVAVGALPMGDMGYLVAAQARFFEQDASEDRKRALRDNLAALPRGASFTEAFYAETPKRFFDPRFDAASLFVGADYRPALLRHIMGTLTPAWNVLEEKDSLAVPLLLALGRYDYIVPYVLWDGVAARLPGAAVHVFQRSGHQPFVEEPEEFSRVVTEWMAAPGVSAAVPAPGYRS
jgi:proline iminopeptidase